MTGTIFGSSTRGDQALSYEPLSIQAAPLRSPNKPRIDLADDPLGDLLSSEKPQRPAVSAGPAPPPAPKIAPNPSPAKKPLVGGLFRRKAARPVDLDSVLASEGPAQKFTSQLVSNLAGAVPGGRFDGYLLEPAVDGDTLASIMAANSLDTGVVVEALASVANAMLVPLVDEACDTLKEPDGARTLEALAGLQSFMAHAGSIYEQLTPGAPLKPVTYSGKVGKGKLEALYTLYVSKAESAGIAGASIDTLQRVLGIKDAKAEQIGQKVMMESVMNMVQETQESGTPEEIEAMQQMLGGMTGMDPGAMSAMGGAAPPGGAGFPGDVQTMIDVLKETLAAPEADRAEVRRELSQTFKTAGTSIEQIIELMSQQSDPKAKELVQLFKQLNDPKYKPQKPNDPKYTGDDLLGI